MNDELSWIDRARRLVECHEEAVGFVQRVGERLPTAPSDALAVAELWVEAESLDTIVCSLLERMNSELLEEKAELDTTRGASIRPAGFDEEGVFYECSWLLQWGEGCGVMVNLAVEPRARFYEANVHAMGAEQTQNVQHPVSERELKEGLVNAYVLEATLDGSAGMDANVEETPGR